MILIGPAQLAVAAICTIAPMLGGGIGYWIGLKSCNERICPIPSNDDSVCKDVIGRLEVVEKQIQSLNANLTDELDKTELALNEAQSSGFSSLNLTLISVNETAIENFCTTSSQLDILTSVVNQAHEYVKELKGTVVNLKELASTQEKEIRDLKALVSDQEQQMENLSQKSANIEGKMEDQQSIINGILPEISGIVNAAIADKTVQLPCEKVPDNSENMNLPLMISMTMNIGLFILVIAHVLCKKGETERQSNPGDAAYGTSGFQDFRRNGPRKDISVLTFSESTMDDVRGIFRSLNKELPQHYMIRDANEVRHVPPSRGYLVVIGYDGRHSIVEDMDDTHGSKKRETITKLEKAGGDVMVVYIDNDTSSGSLADRDLYHRKLERPRKHPVLAPIVRNERFLSMHRGQLTAHQTEHVRNWIHNLDRS